MFDPQEEHWPLFLSLIVVPTFIQLLLLPWFPESPRYLLIDKSNIHATVTALKWYRTKCNIQEEIEEMQEEQRSLSFLDSVSVLHLFLDKSVRWQLLSIIVINMGMQLSGIDAIWFYTNTIFENAGIPKPQIQYTTVGTGAIEVIAGLIGCFTIEKLGRRPLMIGGFSFMGICCAGITLSLILQTRVAIMRYVSVICVVGIIAGFCIGPAGVPFLMTAELFTQSHRPAAYTIGGSLNWISNFTVGFVFPFLQMSAGAFCYLVFCGICVAVAVYVFFVIPETKNKTFVEISNMFATEETSHLIPAVHNNCEAVKPQNGHPRVRGKKNRRRQSAAGSESRAVWTDSQAGVATEKATPRQGPRSDGNQEVSALPCSNRPFGVGHTLLSTGRDNPDPRRWQEHAGPRAVGSVMVAAEEASKSEPLQLEESQQLRGCQEARHRTQRRGDKMAAGQMSRPLTGTGLAGVSCVLANDGTEAGPRNGSLVPRRDPIGPKGVSHRR
ncbi:GTR9 protein, partial [Polypterus senegalus]